MENIRSGNLSVANMRAEILQSINILENSPLHKRAMRQLTDGDKFLKMISRPPYCNCKTVSELKKKISEEREKLKEIHKDTDKYTANYQLSIFDLNEEVSEERLEKIKNERNRLEQEIHWLHKCLGICSNKNYFK